MSKRIKHPHIIHYVMNGRYICIGTCGTTKEKSTTNLKEVTCQNCLRVIKMKPATEPRIYDYTKTMTKLGIVFIILCLLISILIMDSIDFWSFMVGGFAGVFVITILITTIHKMKVTGERII